MRCLRGRRQRRGLRGRCSLCGFFGGLGFFRDARRDLAALIADQGTKLQAETRAIERAHALFERRMRGEPAELPSLSAHVGWLPAKNMCATFDRAGVLQVASLRRSRP